MNTVANQEIEPIRWGLPLEEIKKLGDRLYDFCERFRPAMRTKTHDTSEYGVEYVSGLLRMETERTITNISRKTECDKQGMHHFISNSPWSSHALVKALAEDIRADTEWATEAVLLLDESANEKTGTMTAGAGRQYNGRLGKIDIAQVGVFLSLATPRANCWIDGELFIPKDWFEPENEAKRTLVGIPTERQFATKPELGWQMIQRAVDNGIPFVALDMDELYGRNQELCLNLDQAGIEYYGDVPADTIVYLSKPTLKYPRRKDGKIAKRYIVHGQRYQVRDLLHHPSLERMMLTLRPNERGLLQATFARRPVWIIRQGRRYKRWLLIRQDEKRITYVLSNASPDTSLETMARRKTHRYFIERSNQDAKSELGWDEFQAIKYTAWQHHLALTVLAAWFITQTRLDWMRSHPHDPELLTHYEIDVLPLLSVRNVRELLRSALPLPQLTSEQAVQLVIEKLENRLYSRKSRLHKSARAGPVLET